MAKTTKVRTGVEGLYYAKILSDDDTSGLTYEAPVAIPGLITMNVNPNTNSATLYADNKAAVTYSSVGTIEVEIELDYLADEVIGVLTGREIDGATHFVTNINSAPYVGIMYKQTYDDGSESYVRLMKGKFKEPSHNSETQNDSVNFQTGTIMAEFIATSSKLTIGSSEKSVLMASIDTGNDNFVDLGTNNWFDALYPIPVPSV